MARVNGSQDKDKYFKACYALAAIVLVVGIMLAIGFGSNKFMEYLDTKDYEKGICTATNLYQYNDPDDTEEYKIWCSCNDKERNEPISPCRSDRASGGFDILCWRQEVTIESTNKTTWMRNTYHKKGYECTNCCIHRTVEEMYKIGISYPCMYDPADPTAAAIPWQRSDAWKVHTFLWPILVIVIGCVWLIVTCVCHAKSRKSGSQSYV